MKRRQISGIGFTEKIFPLAFATLGFCLETTALIRQEWNTFIFLGLISFIVGSYFTWRAFKKVHPVYFDDDAFYWKEKGVEQVVNYIHLINLTIHWQPARGGGKLLDYISFKHNSDDVSTKFIEFYPISLFNGDIYWLLVQCENAIRIKMPEFEITGYTKQLQNARDIDKARTYKLR